MSSVAASSSSSAAPVRQPKAGEIWYNPQDFRYIYINSVSNNVNYYRIDIETLRLVGESWTSHPIERFHADGWQLYPRGPRVGQQASNPLVTDTKGTIEAIRHMVGYIEIKIAGDEFWYRAGGFLFTDTQRQPKVGERWRNRNNLYYFIIVKISNGEVELLKTENADTTTTTMSMFLDHFEYEDEGVTEGVEWMFDNEIITIREQPITEGEWKGWIWVTNADESSHGRVNIVRLLERGYIFEPERGQIWRRNNLGVRKVFIIVKKDDGRMVLLDINDGTTRVFYFRNGRDFKSDYTFVDRGVYLGDEWSGNNWRTYFTILTFPVDKQTALALANGLPTRVHDSDNEDESPAETYYVQVQNSRDNSIEYRELLPLAFDILKEDRKYRVRIGDGEVILRRFLESSDSDNEPAGRGGSGSSSSGTSLASAPAQVPKRGQLRRHRGGVYSVVVDVGEGRYYEGDIWVKRYVVHRISSYGSFKDKLSDFLDNQKYVGEFDGSQWKYRARQEEVRDVTVSLMNDARVKVEDEEGTSDFHPRLQFFLKNATFVPVGSNAKKRKKGTSSSSREAKKRATKEAQDMGKCPICYENMGIVEEVEGEKTNYFQLQKDGGVRIGDKEVKVLVCCNAAIHYDCFLGLIENGLEKCPLCKKSLAGGVRDPLDVKIVGYRQITQIVYRCRHLKF